ncbi:MAG TPA: multiheme c-type cytochrome [Fimbriimonas sp.]|nr:multiheme c-type cytochrome [Fimbriimonas sp.]
MKILAGLFCIVGVVAALRHTDPAASVPSIVLIGDHMGYLSPCGCTEPMSGGIQRQATIIQSLQQQGNSLLLDTGGMVAGDDRQSVLKAETLGRVLGKLNVAGVNLTVDDAKLGPGELQNVFRLTRGRITSGSLESGAFPYQTAGEFLIAGASAQPELLAGRLKEHGVELHDAVSKAVSAAELDRKRLILMLDGDENQARDLASQFPTVALIAYRSKGAPSPGLIRVGNVALVTVGERGEYVVSLQLPAGGQPIYQIYDLKPNVPDDDNTSKIYRQYLSEIGSEKLWENRVRGNSLVFAGSQRCGDCHQKDYRIWHSSQHAGALKTLEHVGHELDPECLPCHTTGGDFVSGFRTAKSTPKFGNVGCEQCHGAGADHSRAPHKYPLKRIGADVCLSCHKPLNSPNFDFDTYWAQIRH